VDAAGVGGPLDVPCAGCGELTPYRVGDHPGDGSFGEFLSTPLGDCYQRTHWTRECVKAGRAKVQGRRIDERLSTGEKLTRKLESATGGSTKIQDHSHNDGEGTG
jgi:hypothetical protein